MRDEKNIAERGEAQIEGGLVAKDVQARREQMWQQDATLQKIGYPDGGEYIGQDGFLGIKGSPTVEQPKPQALDEAVAARLWTVSEHLTGVVYPPLA